MVVRGIDHLCKVTVLVGVLWFDVAVETSGCYTEKRGKAQQHLGPKQRSTQQSTPTEKRQKHSIPRTSKAMTIIYIYIYIYKESTTANRELHYEADAAL